MRLHRLHGNAAIDNPGTQNGLVNAALLAFNSGGVARELADWSDDEVVASAMGALSAMFG